jgi:hypothetical protein
MQIKNHDDFPKFDHHFAPSFWAERDEVRFAAPPQRAPWGGATRSTGEFSIGTSGENYSGINRPLGAASVRLLRPGKLTDNAFNEAFNSRFRAECLNAHWFMNLAAAQKKLEDWRKYYNEERPTWGNRPQTPNKLLNHDPAILKEPENSTRRRSKVRPHCRHPDNRQAA